MMSRDVRMVASIGCRWPRWSGYPPGVAETNKKDPTGGPFR